MRIALPQALRGRLPVAVPRRLRWLFRLAFVVLLAATLGLALEILQDEKQRGHHAYADSLRKSEAQIAARLRHPTGQLMLLNAAAADLPPTPLVPLLLPFGAIDFDDRLKAQQAVELAGCGVQYADGATLCAGIGSSAQAGAFVYVVGQIPSGPLQGHEEGELDLSLAHRVWVEVSAGGEARRWIAPFQRQAAVTTAWRGRLVAFDADAAVEDGTRPQRDVRGWLWQDSECLGGAAATGASAAGAAGTGASAAGAAGTGASAAGAAEGGDCTRRTWLSLRLPVPAWRAQLDTVGRSAWPPADLAQSRVRVQLLAPGEGAVLFDSDNPGRGGVAAASAPFAMAEFRRLLLPGETLTVQHEAARDTAALTAPLLQTQGDDPAPERTLPWIDTLIRWLPVPGYDAPIESRSVIATRAGNYRLTLRGDLRSVNRQLAAVATRLVGYVAAMLGAVALLWLLLELLVMRRIALLTRRAAAVSDGVRAAALAGGSGQPLQLDLTLDLQALRGRDELGVLAQGLRDLLARVNADVEREQIRARHERDQWHAVGHEIVSPLQSLIALHGADHDPAARYLRRMQQAIRVLYGQASPSEAFESTQLTLAPLDLEAFLAQVAANAQHVGLEAVHYRSPGTPLLVRADEHSLEDVLAHLLGNAQRHCRPGTPIELRAEAGAQEVRVTVHNQGDPIPEALLGRIFEYGVSGPSASAGTGQPGPSGTSGQRGQGLFVARTYMAKMGGTISARNTADGVEFTLVLPRLDRAEA